MITEVFRVNGHPEFELTVRCNVTLHPSDRDEVYIEATGSEKLLEDLKISQHGNLIVIRQEGSGGSCISIGGMTQINTGNSYGQQVISMNGATYINSGGNVYVNGKLIETGSNSGEGYEPVQIEIYSPGVPSLDLNIQGSNQFNSTAPLSQAKIDASGSCRITLGRVEDLNVDVSGSTRIKVGYVAGLLDVDSSGSAQLQFNGEYDRVNLDVAGSGQIETTGTCRGNYKVDAAGSCYIRHTGEILGRVRKSTAGRCQVYVG